MSNRATRRAAERSAQRPAAAPATISEAQLAANRANAQLSSGPKTETGKSKSSHNALKTGLTGRTILLPADDVAAYLTLVSLINQKFDPANDVEKHLTQSITDTEWRLLRIPTLEAGLYALGRRELAAECAHESNPQTRASMLEALIFRTYQKDLRNLALQERRLRSQLKADTVELRHLQAQRREAQTTAPQPKPAATQPQNGFEFSTPVFTPATTPSGTLPSSDQKENAIQMPAVDRL
jgi:hypothetical protein